MQITPTIFLNKHYFLGVMVKSTTLSYILLLSLLLISLTYISVAEKPPLDQKNITKIQAPADRVTPDQIKVYPNQIVLNVKGASWASFTPTHSMNPVLDEHTNALEVKPQSPLDIHLGDIIAYTSNDGVIIHRVIEINSDAQGTYYIVKGDNNDIADPLKVRFTDIQGVVVAVIY